MKTVKQPRKSPAAVRLKCNNDACAAEMMCEVHELKRVSDQRDGDTYVMRCPHCAKDTWVDAKLVDREAGLR